LLAAGCRRGGSPGWFCTGEAHALVADKWRRDGKLEIDTNWRLNFRDVTMRPPEYAGLLSRTLAEPMVDHVNRHHGDLPLEFQLTLNEDHLASGTRWQSGFMDCRGRVGELFSACFRC
jgi:hypothetical protein